MFWIGRALLQVKKYFFPLFYRVISISLNVISTTCLAIRLKLIHLIFPQQAACMGKILVIRVEGEPASAENRVLMCQLDDNTKLLCFIIDVTGL